MTELNPADGLSERIFVAVRAEKDRVIKWKLMISRWELGLSGMISVTAAFFFGQAIAQSEFWNIVSLIFSDMATVAQNWQNFSYSLLETFPIISAAAILAPIMALMFSFSKYLEINNRVQHV